MPEGSELQVTEIEDEGGGREQKVFSMFAAALMVALIGFGLLELLGVIKL